MSGSVISIHITPEEGASLEDQQTVQLVAGRGVVGDRYCDTDPDDQITLVDADRIDEVNATTGWRLVPSDTRRNIVTRGIDLNQWEQGRFRVGTAVLEGVELCEPCASLGALLENETRSAADVVSALTHVAGLRARILTDAEVSVGDAVTSIED